MIGAFVRDHGNAFVKVAGTTNGLAWIGATQTTTGNTLVAFILFDNAATASKPVVTSIAKPAGETNNWVFLGAARYPSAGTAGAFASGEIWAIQTTTQWFGSSSYIVTLDTSVTMKAAHLLEFSGVLPVLRNTVGTAYSTTTTQASASTTGTTPVAGDVALGFIFASNHASVPPGDTDNLGAAPWSTPLAIGSTGSGLATNNHGLIQYKVLVTGAHMTLNNSAVLTAGNGAIVAVLQAAPDPSITQAAYQWFDEGTESGAVALAAVNTAVPGNIVNGDATGTLRVRLQSTTAVAVPSTDDFALQWERNANGTWLPVGSAALIDSYAESNQAGADAITTTGWAYGQSFLGNGGRLSSASFWMRRILNPGGNVSAVLYAHTGTYGSGRGANPVLTSSITLTPAASIGTSYAWYNFDFDGTFEMADGTPYVIAVYSDVVGDASNYIDLGYDITAPTHAGSASNKNTSNVWSSAAVDYIFRVYSLGPVVPYASPNLPGASPTTNRLGAGTGSFVAGEISEDGVVNDLGWTGNNYTELVYALKVLASAVNDGDTLRFRVVHNGATATMTYGVTPTINIVSGPTGPGPVALAGNTSGVSTSAGTTLVRAIPLVGSAASSSTTTAALSVATAGVAHALVGSAGGTSTTTAALARAVPLGGTAGGVTATSGTQQIVARALAGSSTATSATTGTLSTAGVITPAIPGTRALEDTDQRLTEGGVPRALESFVAGGPVALTGSADGSSTATGAAVATRGLAAAATGSSTTVAALAKAVPVAGTAGGLSTTTAATAVARALATTTGVGTSTASATTLVKTVALAGTAGGSSTAAGTRADIARALTGTSTAATVTSNAPLPVARALAGTAGATSTAAATTLVRVVAAAASADGSATATGALAVVRALAGTSLGQSTTTGDLAESSALALVATADGLASAAATTLVSVRGLAGSAAATSTASAAPLVALRALAATAGASSTTTGSLAAGRPLAGSAAASSTAAATTLVSTRGLTASAGGTSTTTGALAVARALTAPVAGGTSTTTAALATARPLAAASGIGGSTTTGAVIVARTIVGSATASSTATGALRVARALVATSGGVAATSANMVSSAAGGMSSYVSGSSTASGSLGVVRALAGSTGGLSASSAGLAKAVAMSGTAGGVATTTAAVAAARLLVGASGGGSTVTGSFVGSVSLVASSSGGATAGAGLLGKIMLLTGATSGLSAAAGTRIVVARSLSGTTGGLSTTTAGTAIARSLQARTDGLGTALAEPTLAVGLRGATNGVADAVGALEAFQIAAISGMWNGETFEAMQFGDQQVVEWMMILP